MTEQTNTEKHTKAGILTAVCADILNEIEKEAVNEGFRLPAEKVYDIIDRMCVVRDALVKVALDEGIPDDMILKTVPSGPDGGRS